MLLLHVSLCLQPPTMIGRTVKLWTACSSLKPSCMLHLQPYCRQSFGQKLIKKDILPLYDKHLGFLTKVLWNSNFEKWSITLQVWIKLSGQWRSYQQVGPRLPACQCRRRVKGKDSQILGSFTRDKQKPQFRARCSLNFKLTLMNSAL